MIKGDLTKDLLSTKLKSSLLHPQKNSCNNLENQFTLIYMTLSVIPHPKWYI